MEQVYPANAAPADLEAPRWKCVLAAAPQLLLALQFFLALWGVSLFGITAANLASVMWIEALMVSLVVYLGALWLWRPVEPRMRRMKRLLFAVVIVIFTLLAMGRDPMDSALFAGLAVATFFGLALSWRQRTALLQFAARWVVAYATLWFATEFSGNVNALWADQQKVLGLGAFYFSFLAAAEIGGLYLRLIPRHSTLIEGYLDRGRATVKALFGG